MELNEFKEKVSVLDKWLVKKGATIEQMVNLVVKDEQIKHNYNLIKNNPEMTLEEFLEKAIVDVSD